MTLSIPKLRSEVDAIRDEVRSADFRDPSRLERSWKNRFHLTEDDPFRLHLHTLAWEYYDSRGEYRVALDRLLADGVVERAYDNVVKAAKDPQDFILNVFPKDLPKREVDQRFVLWRRSVLCVMTRGFASHRLQMPDANRYLATATAFIDDCLVGAGFPCRGILAQLHYFIGHLHEASYELVEAGREYDRSLQFCVARADQRMSTSSGQLEGERSYAVYCLGRLALKFGQLDYERGRLDSAKRHTREAGLLLRVDSDHFLPHLAELLLCRIERDDREFFVNGWDIVRRMRECEAGLHIHRPYCLLAAIEAVKASVYLRDAERKGRTRCSPPEPTKLYPSFDLALKELGGILLEARTLELTELSCQACLATARTLNRKGEFGEAARWVREARLYLSGQPTRKLQAEAEFVDGKICATRAALLNGSKRAEWLESALARFIAALKAGHGSATFEVACREQIAEIQRRLGRLDDARLTISAARSAAREMDGTFLQDRLLKMQREMDEAKHCFFEIGPGFNMDQAALELYTKYILSIASGVGLPPIDLPGNFRLIKGMVAPLSRVRFNRLWSMVKESGAFK